MAVRKSLTLVPAEQIYSMSGVVLVCLRLCPWFVDENLTDLSSFQGSRRVDPEHIHHLKYHHITLPIRSKSRQNKLGTKQTPVGNSKARVRSNISHVVECRYFFVAQVDYHLGLPNLRKVYCGINKDI